MKYLVALFLIINACAPTKNSYTLRSISKTVTGGGENKVYEFPVEYTTRDASIYQIIEGKK